MYSLLHPLLFRAMIFAYSLGKGFPRGPFRHLSAKGVSHVNRAMLKQYTRLVEFLGLTLGPSYEITLHDVSGKTSSIVAIANGGISGRDLNSPPTSMAMQAVEDNAAGQDYRTNYTGLTNSGKVLRSSTYYIKDSGGNLAGMLCINFDDSKFQAFTSQLFQLIHPDNYVENNIAIRSDILEPDGKEREPERFNDSVTSAAYDVVREVLNEDGIPVDRLTQAEKIRIIAQLEQRGVFRLKGAVEHVSQALCSSPASIYRYLTKVRAGDGGT